MDVPIESVDDLADQTAIEYGTIHGGSSMAFFQVSARGGSRHWAWAEGAGEETSVLTRALT